jgi:hypothetical protein
MAMGCGHGFWGGNCPSDKYLSNSLSLISKPRVVRSIRLGGTKPSLLVPAAHSAKRLFVGPTDPLLRYMAGQHRHLTNHSHLLHSVSNRAVLHVRQRGQ